MLFIAVDTVYYSPLTHISHMIFHMPSFHFHVTVGIGTSDNIASTALKMCLKQEAKNEIHTTVDSCYCGHPQVEDLVSVIARVRNSGVQEKKIIFSLNLMK